MVHPWRDKYARDISFLTIQQMVSVVDDIAESNALTWRELILDRPVPLLDVGCFPRPVVTDEPLNGYTRVYVNDPFGNRIELMEPDATAA